MQRDQCSDQQLYRPSALRIVTGEVVATRLEQVPTRHIWGRLVPLVPEVAWGQLAWGRIALRTIAVLATGAATAGLVWLAVKAVLSLIAAVTALVTFVVAWVHAHLGLLVLGAALLLCLFIRFRFSGSSCTGLHCGGCRR